MSDSQCKAIAEFLAKPGACLTALDGLRMFGCSRTAARVNDLRRRGMDIRTTMISVVGNHGPAKVAEYSMGVKP